MKYEKFIELREELGDYGDSLAYEMCCGFTGDGRYCDHLIRHPQYADHECKLELNPIDMKDWICSKHPLRKIEETVEEEKEKPKEVKPNISKWFDINMEGD